MQALSILAFGMASNAVTACAAVCAQRFFSTGFSSFNNQNYLEVGGADVASLRAFGNISANLVRRGEEFWLLAVAACK
eukprot:SAG31_NODE_1914_length_6931_cov_6.490340_2_plen_78_part_00